MRHIKLFTILLALSVLLSGCCSLMGKPPCIGCDKKAQMGHCFKGRHGDCPFAKCFMKAPCCALKNKEKLGLSAEQETKIKDLCAATKKSSIQIESDVEKIEVDIKAKIKGDTFDAAGINALIDKKFELKKQMIKSIVFSHATLLGILTPEQREKFREIKKECKKGCCDKGDCKSGKCSDCDDDDDDHDEHDEDN